MSRLLMVDSVGEAYQGKDVILIAGEIVSIKLPMNVFYILGVTWGISEVVMRSVLILLDQH
jgi:hypothetical protein